jgi:hypothetical protein
MLLNSRLLSQITPKKSISASKIALTLMFSVTNYSKNTLKSTSPLKPPQNPIGLKKTDQNLRSLKEHQNPHSLLKSHQKAYRLQLRLSVQIHVDGVKGRQKEAKIFEKIATLRFHNQKRQKISN